MSSLFLAPFVVFCLYLTLKNLLNDQFSKVNELICIILYSFITEESRFPQVLLPKIVRCYVQFPQLADVKK